ncbi:MULTISPECIES: dihydrodipicolinate reductase [unclassified Mycobacterium]|uniref:NAD(P)H-dependent amine dehydrogenase family protein n=1 Tax=unclassified Mycobacterium TaxID=2642494 RepID=UPI0007401F6F|nr:MULTISPECIES: dihydrodipicolinate reductase [unclassified Mycobacterium]KUH85536.1 dihydrodipicolinate reductase [Mycobacterium sp. GA-1999]KUH91394.1 dihydrodipicolinate reductase [Mycobacterium sp. GA-0227b]KUH96351.1 dihydrodipicolinate reductase [Mycobacterium sp. IS-1556]
MSRRIIQFSTGNVGIHALRTIIGRPDLELVGVHAASPGKIGRDAADLCGLPSPTGVIATSDIEELVALQADCVVYTSQAETRPHEALADLIRFLSTGTNVVGTSFVWLVAPDFTDAWLREPLERACHDGNSTLYVNGIDPGFSGDTLVYAALSLAGRATAITVQEICEYGSYDDAEFTGVSFGFGTDPKHEPILFAPGVLASMWGTQVRSLARDLGVTLDEVRERHEKWVTPEPVSTTMMDVSPGQVAAVRFGVEGIRDGEVVITMEHINRLTPADAPHWTYPPDGRPGVHRVTVAGDPGITIDTHVGGSGIDHNIGGVVATAARAVNAVEAVCRAPAGILAAHNLRPLDHLRGTMW